MIRKSTLNSVQTGQSRQYICLSNTKLVDGKSKWELATEKFTGVGIGENLTSVDSVSLDNSRSTGGLACDEVSTC